MKNNFPSNWYLNIKTLQRLAAVLSFDEKDLASIERTVPRRYRLALIKGRVLSIPDNSLKAVQKSILKNVFNFPFSNYVHGGVKNRSIITNATVHKQQKWVACLDIRKFFPSVHYSKILSVFYQLQCSPEVAKTITHFTTYRHQLPQGSPTSPVIANLVLFNFDLRVDKLCKIKGFRYSRYFDDITISGNKPPMSICLKIVKVAEQEGFKIPIDNPEKFRIIPNSQPQIVTGLIVNGKNLKIDPSALTDLEKTLSDLAADGIILDNPQKQYHKIKGLLSYLQSVQPNKARLLTAKFGRINWERYGVFH